ncbi:MAG: hypothetical protein C5B52_14395 [Bacteroidetes bacterium]|nr:MAG: hypothetical protein C5B52_14395 [Bacteroidota bacterium]
MKKWSLLVVGLFLSVLLSAQNETIVSDKEAEIRDLKDFHGVKIAGSIDLFISQGPKEVVAVSASSQEVKDDIITEVKDGILNVHPKKGSNWWKMGWNTIGKRIRVYVAARNIDYINSAGSGNIIISGEIKADKLEFIVAGSGNIEGAINTETLSVDQSGSSNVRLRGNSKSSNFNMSGSGNLYSYDLVTENTDIDISGSGNVEITSNKEVNAKISGSGNIRIKGNADLRTVSTSGSGHVRRV